MSNEHQTPPVTETTATTTTSAPDASKHSRNTSKQAAQTTQTQAATKDTKANEEAATDVSDTGSGTSQVQSAETTATQTYSTSGQMALDQIKEYISAMAPNRPVSVEEGNRYQVMLYRAITTIINRLDVDFQPAFTSLLKSFDKHRDGVFHETYVFRFFDQMTLPENDRKAFQRLLNLIKVTASVKGRELAMRQLDLEGSLELGVTEPGRQRVLSYFRQ